MGLRGSERLGGYRLQLVVHDAVRPLHYLERSSQPVSQAIPEIETGQVGIVTEIPLLQEAQAGRPGLQPTRVVHTPADSRTGVFQRGMVCRRARRQPAEDVSNQPAAREGLVQPEYQSPHIDLIQIHQQSFRHDQQRLPARRYCVHPLQVRHGGGDHVVALGFGEEPAAEVYHRRHVQVVPVDPAVIYAQESAVQTAAQLQHHASGVLIQEIPRDDVQFLGPLADQNDRLVGDLQAGKVIVHPVQDI